MEGGQEFSTTEVERLRQKVQQLREERDSLAKQLSASERDFVELLERFKLTPEEAAVLAGREDGLIRIGELHKVLVRIGIKV